MLFNIKIKCITVNIKTIFSKNKKNLTIIYGRLFLISHDTVLMLNLVFFKNFLLKNLEKYCFII